MEFLYAWLGTVLLTVGIEGFTQCRKNKDAADNGYKIDYEKVRRKLEKANPDFIKLYTVSFLFPFVNILNALENSAEYEEIRWCGIDALRNEGVLTIMDNDEIKEFEKNPTGFNAMKISLHKRTESGLLTDEKKVINYSYGNDRESRFSFYEEEPQKPLVKKYVYKKDIKK